MNWKQVEVMGYSYYIERGYRVLVPLVSSEGYDFVAEKNGKFVRVNVKCAGLKDKTQPNSWCIAQASGGSKKPRRSHSVDVYLTWMPSVNRFLEIDGEFLNSGNSKSRRIPRLMYLT